MSAYRSVETKINDKECLVDALKKMKFRGVNKDTVPEIENHEEPVNLVGYHGDTRKDKAEIVIRRKQVGTASNDIGFKKSEDGNYTAIISDFDSGFYNKAWVSELKTTYAEMKAKKVAKQADFSLQKKITLPNGTTRLVFGKNSF